MGAVVWVTRAFGLGPGQAPMIHQGYTTAMMHGLPLLSEELAVPRGRCPDGEPGPHSRV